MNRRVCRRISRCPFVDSISHPPSTALQRGCRNFHSSPSCHQSGNQTAPRVDNSSTKASSSQSPPRPSFKKFGGAWGTTKLSSSKPSGLTAAELASRNALRAAAPAPASPATQATRLPPTPRASSTPENLGTRASKSASRESPYWTCPNCLFRCQGSRTVCPKCLTRNQTTPSVSNSDAPILKTSGRKPSNAVASTGQKENAQSPSYSRFPSSKNFRFGRRQEEVASEPQPPAKQLSTQKIEQLSGHKAEQTTEQSFVSRDRTDTARPAEQVSTAAEKEEKPQINDFDKWMATLEELKKAESSQDVGQASRVEKAKVNKKGRAKFGEEDDYDPDERKQRKEKRKQKKNVQVEVEVQRSPLYLPEFISVGNLADVLGVRQAEFIEHLEEIGFEGVGHSHVLDAETAGLIAEEYNFEPVFETSEKDLVAAPEPEDKSCLPQRPPVVTIMGHVDHGKTTLLDWLRKSSVAASEHGGITQHIGAFSVVMPSGKSITFLDTPGHAAFLDMRRRGADITDIVVLVVAADDSVKPQTIEAIKHAKQANVPMIVAINKMDKDNVNAERVKQDLARHGVDVEDFGGDVQAIPVSGKTGLGMLDLEEAIVTLSEMLDHRAEVEGGAEGWVVEATTKKAGRVATILVKRGTMRPGSILVAGTTWTRIKTLKNEAGVEIEEATPGMPVEIDGWREQPEAGSEVLQATSEQRAKEVVEYRLERSEIAKLGQDTAAINASRREALENRRQLGDEGVPETTETSSGPKSINFIVKADVSGSVEAVVNSIVGIGNNEVIANVLRSGVGQVSEFDIKHAATSEASIITFNSAVDPTISRMAESQGVSLMNHTIIYELIDDVKAKLSEHLSPTVTYRVTGEAEISQQFEITIKGRKKTLIAGCKVRNGVISRSKKVRVLRDKEIIYEGSLSSLRNVKKDVTEMRKDTECGLGFQDWSGFQPGDHVQSYEEIVEKRYLH